jgi:dCTP deaminase
MILSARSISARLVEAGCLPVDPARNDQNSPLTGNRENRDQNTSAPDRKEPGRHLVISPFAPDSLQPASYDLRVSLDMVLPKGACTLVPSLEWVEIPGDLAATLRCRSSYGRRGVIISAGFVDPGFRGQLTLCLVNMGSEDIALKRNDRIVQMIIHEVREGGMLYSGRYQDSHGAIDAR